MAKKNQQKQSEELRRAYIELLTRKYHTEGFREQFEKTIEDIKEIIPKEFFEKCLISRPAVIDARSIHGDTTYPAFPDISDFPERWEHDKNFIDEYESRLKSWSYKMREHFGLESNLECMNFDPGNTLLLGIDLTRSKEAIMAEFEEILNKHKIKVENRLKWLSKINEILQVWDIWESYGKRHCWYLIARRLNIPRSTVKARWRLAYKLIHGEEYSQSKAADQSLNLCAGCRDYKSCYKIVKKRMEFTPCSAYLKLVGREYSREKIYENFEEIVDQKSYEDFLQEKTTE